jgi:hypothetical protein
MSLGLKHRVSVASVGSTGVLIFQRLYSLFQILIGTVLQAGENHQHNHSRQGHKTVQERIESTSLLYPLLLIIVLLVSLAPELYKSVPLKYDNNMAFFFRSSSTKNDKAELSDKEERVNVVIKPVEKKPYVILRRGNTYFVKKSMDSEKEINITEALMQMNNQEVLMAIPLTVCMEITSGRAKQQIKNRVEAAAFAGYMNAQMFMRKLRSEENESPKHKHSKKSPSNKKKFQLTLTALMNREMTQMTWS